MATFVSNFVALNFLKSYKLVTLINYLYLFILLDTNTY